MRAAITSSWAAKFRIGGYNLAFLALFAASGYAQINFDLPNHDISWLLIAAGRLADGGNYAADFFEVNPPLILLIYMPAVLASRLIEIDLYVALVLLVLTYIGLSLSAMRMMARRLCPDSGIARPVFQLAAGAVLLFTPGYDFGQREHLIVIFTLPYLVLVSASRPDRTLGSGASVAAIGWAAFGLFLKPMYVLLPISVTVARSVERRSLRALLSLDLFVFGILGSLYLALTAVLFPEYFTVASYAARYYPAFKGLPDANTIAIGTTILVIGACLPAFVALRMVRDVAESRIATLLALSAIVSGAAAFLQGKGWSYHFLPIRIFGSVAAVIVIIALARSAARANGGRLSAGAFMLVLGVLVGGTMLSSVRNDRAKVQQYTIGQDAMDVMEGRRVFAVSRHVTAGLPWVPLSGGEWASRFSCLWLLPSYAMLLADESVSTEEKEGLAADMRGFMVEDFEHYRPEIVLIDRNLDAEIGFNALEFYLADDNFKNLWQEYKYFGISNNISIYIHKGVSL